MQDQGQAAAVERNRQREARIRIIEAFQRLGVPRKDWPPFVQKFTGPANRQLLAPAPFQLPAFHRLRQSIEDWAKTADAEWQRHRDAQIQTWAFWVGVGVDDKITEAKRSRGPGKTGRNASANTRHEWAALRLSGLEWKQIAIDYCVKEDRVRKAATDILLGANWARRRR